MHKFIYVYEFSAFYSLNFQPAVKVLTYFVHTKKS
jgi:hypothetical protein